MSNYKKSWKQGNVSCRKKWRRQEAHTIRKLQTMFR